MITEDYVSFETANLLKEKGFAGECSRFYMPNGNGRWKYGYDHDFDISERIDCPTLQMAMKWLREIHKLPINIWYDKEEDTPDDEVWNSEIAVDRPSYILVGSFASYKEACEAAIRYCLENLI